MNPEKVNTLDIEEVKKVQSDKKTGTFEKPPKKLKSKKKIY